MRVAPPRRHLAWPERLRAARGWGLVLVGVVGVLVRVLQVPALALRPRLSAVHGAAVVLPVAGHAYSCQQPGESAPGTHTHGTGCPRHAALTVLALLDAAALVPDVGVDGVTPRAPLVPVGVSAVILLQSVAGGWQEPAGSGAGRSAAGNPSPHGRHSHNAVPSLVSAIVPHVPIAPVPSPLPPQCPSHCPHCPHAVPSPFPVAPHCQGPPVGAAGQLGIRGHLWSCGVVACQCWQCRPFSVTARVPR